MSTKTELGVALQALEQRWPLPPDVRDEVIAMARSLLKNRRTPHRTRVSAAKLLLAADRLNLIEEATGKPLPIDLTSGGKPLAAPLAIDPAAFAAFIADVERVGGRISSNGHAESLDPAHPAS